MHTHTYTYLNKILGLVFTQPNGNEPVVGNTKNFTTQGRYDLKLTGALHKHIVQIKVPIGFLCFIIIILGRQ